MEPDRLSDISAEERAEVQRLVQTTGWLDARDYLRGRGYSLEQANAVALIQPARGPRGA